MKKVIMMLVMILVLTGCGSKVDYTTAEFEKALNNGDDVEGKTVEVEVFRLEPDSAFGYNIQAGDHLNFVSAVNPKVKEGDTIVDKVASMFGSFIITYE